MKKLFRNICLLSTLFITSTSCGRHNYLTNTQKYREYDPTFNTDESPYKIRKVDSLKNRSSDFICGVDASMVYAVEKAGGKYYDYDNKQYDVFKILKNHGVNTVRLRLFVNYLDGKKINDLYGDLYKTKTGKDLDKFTNPAGGELNLENVLSLARRAKASNLNILVDLHYSDYWSDPGEQYTPVSWEQEAREKYPSSEDDRFNFILDKAKTYTKDVLTAFKENNCEADYVQIGNEINSGMLFPYAYVLGSDWDDANVWGKKFDNCATVLKECIKEVRNTSTTTKIALHHSQFLNAYFDEPSWSYKANDWWLDEMVTKREVKDFDIIASSFYPWEEGSNQVPITTIANSINQMASKFNKKVLVMETGTGFTFNKHEWANNQFDEIRCMKGRYPCSILGQTNMLTDLIEQVANASNEKGLGVIYWGGDWLPVKGVGVGGPWDAMRSTTANQALFTYDGLALPTLSVFNNVF